MCAEFKAVLSAEP